MQHRYNDVARNYLLRLSQLQQQQGFSYAMNAPSQINLLNIMQQYESMLQQRNREQLLLGEMLRLQNYEQSTRYNQKQNCDAAAYNVQVQPPSRFSLPHQARYQRQQVDPRGTPQNKQQQQSYFVDDKRDARACIRGGGVDVDSLYPHGETLVEKWSTEDYGRHGRWNYRENPTWRPPVQSRNGEYTGSDLIKARGEHELKSGYRGPETFYENVRSLPWQMVPTRDSPRDHTSFKKNIPSRPWRFEDPSSPTFLKNMMPWQLELTSVGQRSKNLARNLMSDYGGRSSSDCSDSSSTKSAGSSVGYWSLSE